MGSGVAGVLRRAADGPIHGAAVAKGPSELGEVAITDAFDLDADYVIHAAAMPYYGDGWATEETRADDPPTPPECRVVRTVFPCRRTAAGLGPFRPPRCFCARLV